MKEYIGIYKRKFDEDIKGRKFSKYVTNYHVLKFVLDVKNGKKSINMFNMGVVDKAFFKVYSKLQDAHVACLKYLKQRNEGFSSSYFNVKYIGIFRDLKEVRRKIMNHKVKAFYTDSYDRALERNTSTNKETSIVKKDREDKEDKEDSFDGWYIGGFADYRKRTSSYRAFLVCVVGKEVKFFKWLKNKKEFKAYSRIIDYLNKFAKHNKCVENLEIVYTSCKGVRKIIHEYGMKKGYKVRYKTSYSSSNLKVKERKEIVNSK